MRTWYYRESDDAIKSIEVCWLHSNITGTESFHLLEEYDAMNLCNELNQMESMIRARKFVFNILEICAWGVIMWFVLRIMMMCFGQPE